MADEITDPKEIREFIDRLALSIQAIERRLKRFEDEFGMDSAKFYARLQAGQLEQRFEFGEWAGEHERLQRLKAQRADLLRRLGQ